MQKINSIQTYNHVVFNWGETIFCQPSARIGENVRIGRYVIIDEDVVIGDNVFIGHSCVIRSGVEIGNDSVIGHLVVIEKETKIGTKTTIQSQCHITAYADIGNNCYFGPCVTCINEWKISSHGRPLEQKLVGPKIGDGCRIGARSLIMPGVIVGKNAMIGASSCITKPVGENEVWFGSRAELKGIVPEEERI